jgi:hypothetical protein
MVEVTRDLTRSAARVGRHVGNRDFTVRSAVNGVWKLTFAGLLTPQKEMEMPMRRAFAPTERERFGALAFLGHFLAQASQPICGHLINAKKTRLQ